MGKRTSRGLALLATATLASFLVAAPAMAADGSSGDVSVVNTETVQAYFTPEGKLDSQRVYEQLALTGHGSVALTNPISTDGLRNLDGFSGISTEDGHQVIDTSVDGEKRMRTVSTYTGRLPLDVRVAYTLDGKPVEPGDVVGNSGHLQVQFTVRNVTGKPQQVSFSDGHGGTITRTVRVPIPIVGSVTTTTPSSFTNVASEQANMGGDGKGGTQLSFTLTLFPPIGSTTAQFGYSADITDGVVPRVSVSALPVNPMESPTFKSAANSYQGGADTGAQLVAGAAKIDSNLLKLRDGAAQLLAGLIRLNDGAHQLDTGLSGTAVPGAAKLATGAGDLSNGLGDLSAGAGRLADGTSTLKVGTDKLIAGTGRVASGSRQVAGGASALAGGARKVAAGADQVAGGSGDLSDGADRLAAGTDTALAGSKKLTTGLAQISGGLGQLSAQLPGAQSGVDKLKAGVDQLIAGIGPTGDPAHPGILDGLAALQAGIGDAVTADTLVNGVTQIKGGLQLLVGADGLPKARGGVDAVKGQLDAAVSAGSLKELLDGVAPIAGACSADALCAGVAAQYVAAIQAAQTTLDGNLQAASAGLGAVSAGLGGAIDQINGLMLPGTDKILTGLGTLSAGVTKLQDGANAEGAGLQTVRAGLDDLAAGVTAAVSGVAALNTGAGAAYQGSTDLTDGLGTLDAGAGSLAEGAHTLADGAKRVSGGASQVAGGSRDLADGAGKLAGGARKVAGGVRTLGAGATTLEAGAGDLADGAARAKGGSDRLAAGAGDLADGLQAAADGAGRIADGLAVAVGKAPAIPEGADELSRRGTSKLVSKGESTTQDYGEMVAVMQAGAQRAQTEDMAYGAPADAIGLTAYNYVIKGADGEGGRDLTRALGGAVLLAAGAGVFALRRRLV